MMNFPVLEMVAVHCRIDFFHGYNKINELFVCRGFINLGFVKV